MLKSNIALLLRLASYGARGGGPFLQTRPRSRMRKVELGGATRLSLVGASRPTGHIRALRLQRERSALHRPRVTSSVRSREAPTESLTWSSLTACTPAGSR